MQIYDYSLFFQKKSLHGTLGLIFHNGTDIAFGKYCVTLDVIMKYMKKLIDIALAILLLACPTAVAQSRFGSVELDRTVYDFGDIQTSDGPVSCTYTVKNTGSKDLNIFNVVSSCGCTDVTWTRSTIKPGETGKISATYKNDDGAYPFDKALTAYFSDLKNPVILHLRGVVHEKKLPLKDMYPVHFGPLGMKEAEISGGNLLQGQQKSGEIKIANIGTAPIKLSFGDVSEGLKLSVEDATIPAGGISTLTYTITTGRDVWGKHWYYATPLINGRKYAAKVTAVKKDNTAKGAEALLSDKNPEIGEGKQIIGFSTFTKDDFSALTREERAGGPNPMFESSTYNFGTIKPGAKIKAEFACTNIGKKDLHIYKIDSDSNRLTADNIADLKPQGKGKVTAVLDTQGLPAGEVLVIVTLTTNSPLRPMVNLYITGFIK